MNKEPARAPEFSAHPEEQFRFAVREIEDLYPVLAAFPTSELQVTKQFLRSPLHSFDIIAEIDKQSFDLTTTIRFPSHEDAYIANDVVESIIAGASEGAEIHEAGGNRVVQCLGGTKLVISTTPTSGTIWISTGEILNDWDDGLPEGMRQRLLPSPELTAEDVPIIMQDYLDFLAGVIATTYDYVGSSTPDIEVVIDPDEFVIRSMDKKVALGKLAITENASVQPEHLIVSIPDVTFDSIGGQEEAKRELKGLVSAITSPESYTRWGTTAPKGILLYGPPGTGKTLFAKALAGEANANFMHVTAADINTRWHGESEQNVKRIFEVAANSDKKTIIFFDELDTIIPPRDDSFEVTQKVTGALLQNIDGLSSSNNVTILASTNRKDAIDSAMLRPGRLDRHIEISLPTDKEREQIFSVQMAKAEKISGNSLFDTIDLSQLAQMTNRFSGADIAEIIRRTLEEKARQESAGLQPTPVTMQDIFDKIAAYEHSKKAQTSIGFFRDRVH